MIKSILRNWDVYKNTNNVWMIYEYIGNNAFTEADVKELWDFIQQNNCFFELFILNVKWDKKYYISFFMWDRAYANNISNFDPAVFDIRYNTIVNLRPKIEKLNIFDGKIKDVNLKLYTFGNEVDNLDYLKKAVQSNGMNYREEEFHNKLLQKYFAEYVSKSIGNQDYKAYILSTFYKKNTNFSFFNVDQAIFEPVLSFVAGNEYFLFPFYYSGINQKTGAIEYQSLDVTKDIVFLDTHLGKDYDIYLKKISMYPKSEGMAIDKKTNTVAVGGTSSKFQLDKINDDQDMFFEINHSLFLYTKKPDVSWFLWDFNKDFGTETILKPKKISKEFNEMYLSHNAFDEIYHLWHIQNVMSTMKITKEYMRPNPRWAYIGKEYFSNNNLEVNVFDIVWLDPSNGTLGEKANGFIIGTSGSGKTYFSKKFVKSVKTEQVIIFDELQNFEQMVDETNAHEFNVIKYWHDFPNIIWRVTKDNISAKQGILYNIVIGQNDELPGTFKTSVRGIINYYMEQVVWSSFKYDHFMSYCSTLDNEVLSESEKRTLMNQLRGLSSTFKSILNNDVDLIESFLSKQKIIISYSQLKAEGNETQYFVVSLLLESVRNYIADKKNMTDEEKKFKYTIMMIDEANLIFWKTVALDTILNDIVRTIRNHNGAIFCIAQMLDDFYFSKLPSAQDAFYDQTTFHWVLSPSEWYKYVEKYWAKNQKNALIFQNLAPQIEAIAQKFNEGQKKAEEAKERWLDENSVKRERFCVFGYSSGNAYYISNTNQL